MKRILNMLTFTILLLAPQPTWAHNLLVQATLHPDKIVVEAFYDDPKATPARAALVQLFRGEKVILEDKTDAAGFCSLPRPDAGDYQVLVNAGAGHRRTIEMHVTATPTSIEEVSPAPASASRTEMTRYPWLKVLIGLGCIGLMSLIYWGARAIRAGTGPSKNGGGTP